MSRAVTDLSPEVATRLAAHQTAFNERFAEYFRQQREVHRNIAASADVMDCLGQVEALSMRGGKRQRIAFLYEAARLVSDDLRETDLHAAALSIELLQTHLLIHDDIIDDAPVRRGGESTYYAYLREFPDQPQAALGRAVLAGDIAAYLAIDVLTRSSMNSALMCRAIKIQTTAGLRTFVGQIMDLERDRGEVPSVEILHVVSHLKASRSSGFAPMALGLEIMGAAPGTYEPTVREYVGLLGISGQMRDDYLSLFGSPAQTGKTNVADVRGGRRTYLIAETLRRASGSALARLEQTLGNADASEADVDFVRELAVSTGAHDHILAEIECYAGLAAEVATTWRTRWNPSAVAFFECMPTWNVERVH